MSLVRLNLRALVLALTLAACSRAPTQIVLVVETDIEVPAQMDALDVVVLGPSGDRNEVHRDLARDGAPRPPYTLGLVSRSTRTGPVFIRVSGTLGGRPIVEHALRTEFVPNETRTVVVRLERSCMDRSCADGTVCVSGSCVGLDVLFPERPVIFFPRVDGGAPEDAGACMPTGPEVCNRADDDCDGRIDETFDLATDALHCGACDAACPDTVACLRGTCGDPAIALGLGEEHSCALRTSGHVACWGANEVGQLGDGTTDDRLAPAEIPGIDDAIALSSGERHACVLRRGGSVWCWGWNLRGQLADAAVMERTTPTRIDVGAVSELSCGYEHTCVRSGATVTCWGGNTRFDATTGRVVDDPTPREVEGLIAPQALVAGNESSCVIETGGAIACWGQGAQGRLGDGMFVDRGLPGSVAAVGPARALARFGFGFYAIETGGAAWGWGANGTGQLAAASPDVSATSLRITAVDGASHIVGGRFHGCALRAGRVLCWGLNARGQIARDATIMEGRTPELVAGTPGGIVSIAAGSNHTCVRTAAAIHCWGDNGRGQLGDGTTTIRRAPVRITLPGATR